MSLPAVSTSQAPCFVALRQVRFSDCDPAGIVFFPNYLVMLNGVVEDWWQHLGLPWTDTIGKRRMGTPVAHLDSHFLAPSSYGDTLRFELRVAALGRSSLNLEHHVLGPDARQRLHFKQRLVCTTLDTHRSAPWPDDMVQAIARFMKDST